MRRMYTEHIALARLSRLEEIVDTCVAIVVVNYIALARLIFTYGSTSSDTA